MDKSEFARQVLEAEQTLYRVSKTILYRDADCEDAVQEAILKAYEKKDTLKNEAFFQTWLVRITINTCYNYLRSNKDTVPFEEYFGDDKEDISAETATRYPELRDALAALPEKIRIAIVLYYVEGYTVAEIGRILHIPAGTVKSRLAKGRKLLKKKLEIWEVDYGY